jgi:Beta-galactosidase trimerisation domain/Carbohydrate family 9 binding domain-like
MIKKSSLISIVGIFALLSVLAVNAGAGELKSFTTPRISIAPIIDGKIGAKEWANAYQAYLKEYRNRKKLKNKTLVYISYDENNLYVAFKCFTKDISKLVANSNVAENRDGSIWNDDCVEVFLDPLSSKVNFYHIIVNTANIAYDAKNIGKFAKAEWNCEFKSAVHIDKNYWSVEFALPFTNFEYASCGGEVWRVNFGREEKTYKEISSLFPAPGGFNNPLSFGRMRFSAREPNKSFSIESLSVNGKDIIAVCLKNRSKSTRNYSLTINSFTVPGDDRIEAKSININLKPDSEKKITLPYKTRLGKQELSLSLMDHSANKVLYKNKVEFTKDDPSQQPVRVWQIEKPLYEQLFSRKQLASSRNPARAFSWVHDQKEFEMRPFALQYGLPYSESGSYEMMSALPMPQIENVYMLPRYADKYRKHKGKVLLMTHTVHAKGVPKAGLHHRPFLPDPVVQKEYFGKIAENLEKHGDIIWGVFAGDETHHANMRRGIELLAKNRDSYPYIVAVDKEVKAKYGNGIYGIPESLNDTNPYRWIAYTRWISDKMIEIQDKLYALVKKHNPNTKLVGYDPMSYHHPYDFSRWNCDIITHQTYPRQTEHRAYLGFITKYLKDLSGKDEVWTCAHVEHTAASFSPEEALELLSQVFRNGGTGIHYYLMDVRNTRKGKGNLRTERYSAPGRWQVEKAVIKEAMQMKKLKFPEPDCAILYSCDSYASTFYLHTGFEIEYAYTFLGPNSGSWFKFIDDNQVARNSVDLSKYKSVYIPFGKYERKEVIEKLVNYVKNGGTLIAGDPEVFSFDIHGKAMDKFREKIFGVTKGSYVRRTTVKNGAIELKNYSKAYNVKLCSKNAKVLAKFENGSPAIVEKRLGKGKAVYFAANPFNAKAIADSQWKKFWLDFQKKSGLATGHDIWRFQFPARLLGKKRTPEPGICLTGNYVFIKESKPYLLNNSKVDGSYSYSLAPDAIKDQGGSKAVLFSKGDLTDRRKAPFAGDVVAKKSKLSDWIVQYNTTDAFDIVFDFKKPVSASEISLIYSGELLSVSFATSNDVKKWRDLNVKIKPWPKTKDVLRETIKFPSIKTRYIKIHFGKREKAKLIISEIEIWNKK